MNTKTSRRGTPWKSNLAEMNLSELSIPLAIKAENLATAKIPPSWRARRLASIARRAERLEVAKAACLASGGVWDASTGQRVKSKAAVALAEKRWRK